MSIEPKFENVSYGPFERNVLDFWRAESCEPTPVVVFIHGGGFVGGDKTKIRQTPDVIRRCLASGVSFAAINYRFRGQAPLPEILRDTARAIQFLRYKAAEWNIDKGRIAAYGGSAGAGSSLWIGFHDDLADPTSKDPVLRESSRLTVVGANATQATYDFSRWPEVLGFGFELQDRDYDETAQLYGLKSREEIDSPKGRAIRRDLDMLGHMDPRDPPVYLSSGMPNTRPEHRGHIVHHPRHAIAIKKKCDELGIEAAIVLRETPPGERVAMLDFFFKHLQVKVRT